MPCWHFRGITGSTGSEEDMKKQAFNPYLPSWEYVPDGEQDPAYITNVTDRATVGSRYFECKGVRKPGIFVRGYAKGIFEVRTTWNGDISGRIPVDFTNVWEYYETEVKVEDGVRAIYLTFRGEGTADLLSFSFVE